MTTEKDHKCAHPVCTCVIASGKYCSVECEAMEKTPDIDCECEHVDCKGRTSQDSKFPLGIRQSKKATVAS
jgi:hypothetical protein